MAQHCDPETDGVDLYGALEEWFENHEDAEAVLGGKAEYFPKTTYNAFFKTDLAYWLWKNDVDTVKLCGVCTDICVFASAAGAYYEGFKVKVLKRGCATLDFLKKNEAQVYEMMKGQFFADIIE